MADENLNAGFASASIESDDEAEKSDEEVVEDPPELMRESSTPTIARIVEEISGLPLIHIEEVRDALTVLIKNMKKPHPKAYINWCAARDKFVGVEKPEVWPKKVGEQGDVPTYTQWQQWNDPLFSTYKGDNWSLVNGAPVRKSK